MNLRECFERIDVEGWASGLGLGALYHPTHAERNGAWVERLLGILAGTVTYRSLFQERLGNEDFVAAAELLDSMSASDRRTCSEELDLQLQASHGKNMLLVQDLLTRSSILKKRSSLSEIASWCSEVAKGLTELKKVSKPLTDLSALSVKTYFEMFTNRVKVKEEEMRLLEEEATRFEKGMLKRGLGFLDSIISEIEPFILDSRDESRKVVERAFLSLPELVLTGQLDMLGQILASVKTRDFQQLSRLSMRSRPPTKSRTLAEAVQIGDKGEAKIGTFSNPPLRSITRQFYYDKLPILEGTFEESKTVRDFVNSQLSRSKTSKEAADWLLRGAKTIVEGWGQSDSPMLGKGLTELGQYLLSAKKYTHAFDVFLDSFRLFVFSRSNGNTVSSDETGAIAGALLADFVPRMIGRRQDSDISSTIQASSGEPAIILEQLVRMDELGVVFRVFDELDDYESAMVFLRCLQDNWPVADWISIVAERVLQPRLFLRETGRGINKLRALVTQGFPDVDISRVLQALEVAEELGEKISRTDLKELEQAVNSFRKRAEASAAERSRLCLLCERLETIVESVKKRLPLASEVRFSFHPVDSLFYLDERSTDLELIMVVTLQENSLPIGSFAVEARIDESQKGKAQQYVTLHGNREEIGYLEPGTSKEIAFLLDIDRNILNEVSAVAINFQYFDRVVAVEPLDKKHTFQVDLRPTRKGAKFNPYVSGPAIEKRGLYVGREGELGKIKDTLIGQTQDNVPIILGIRRIGKTSLLKRLSADEEILRRYAPVLFDFEDMPESDTTADLLKRICSTIHSEIGEKWHVDFLRSSFDLDPLEAFSAYLGRFSQLRTSKRVLLLMDECEKLMANMDKWRQRLSLAETPADPRNALIPEVLGALRKAMLHAEGFSFVICGLPSVLDSIREYESRWFGLMTPVTIEPLKESEAKELIQPAGKIPYRVSSEATEIILHMTGRQPYLIQLICRSLFNFMVSSGRDMVAKKDVEEILERDILPYEPYFTDYKRLIGDDIDILRALATARKRLRYRRRYVAIDMVADQLQSLGHHIQKSELQSRLQQMEKAERPLVERNPSQSDSYRIVIGLLERLLEEEAL